MIKAPRFHAAIGLSTAIFRRIRSRSSLKESLKITLKSICPTGRERHVPNVLDLELHQPSRSLRPTPPEGAGQPRRTCWPLPRALPSPRKSSTISAPGGEVHPGPTDPIQLQFLQSSFQGLIYVRRPGKASRFVANLGDLPQGQICVMRAHTRETARP